MNLSRFCVRVRTHCQAPQHFLCFFPLPHGQGSLRPTDLGVGVRWANLGRFAQKGQ